MTLATKLKLQDLIERTKANTGFTSDEALAEFIESWCDMTGQEVTAEDLRNWSQTEETTPDEVVFLLCHFAEVEREETTPWLRRLHIRYWKKRGMGAYPVFRETKVKPHIQPLNKPTSTTEKQDLVLPQQTLRFD